MTAPDLRYNRAAMALHWIMAALILSLMVLGWLAVNQPLSPLKFDLFWWHKSLGILTLGLAFLRLLWRWLRPPPTTRSTSGTATPSPAASATSSGTTSTPTPPKTRANSACPEWT